MVCSDIPPNSDAGGALDRLQRSAPTGNRVDSVNSSSFPYIEVLRGRDGRDGWDGMSGPCGPKKDKRETLQQQAVRVPLVQGVVGWSTQGGGKLAVQVSQDKSKQTPLSPITQNLLRNSQRYNSLHNMQGLLHLGTV